MDPDEAVGRVATGQEGAKLALDERRQRAVPLACASEKGFQPVCDDAVQDGGLGVPRFVSR